MIRFRPLSPEHDRASFRCGVESLDRYIRESASQAMSKRLSAVVVAVDHDDPHRILGYYALSPTEIDGASMPDPVRRSARLPTHAVGAILLGRLAVDRQHQGRSVGRRLVINAFRRAMAAASLVGAACLAVDAIDESAVRFYTKFGFIRIVGTSRLVITMRTLTQGAKAHGKGDG